MESDDHDENERARRINELLDAKKQQFEHARENGERAPVQADEETADGPTAARKRMAKITDTAADADERKKA